MSCIPILSDFFCLSITLSLGAQATDLLNVKSFFLSCILYTDSLHLLRKKEFINIPITDTADGQVTSSQSFTVLFSVNAVSDHTYPFALTITPAPRSDLNRHHLCKLPPSVGHVRELISVQTKYWLWFLWGSFVTAVVWIRSIKLLVKWPQINNFLTWSTVYFVYHVDIQKCKSIQ